jgi:hypothetical protein
MASVHFYHFSDHSVWDALHFHPSKGCRETCHELEAEHGKGALKSITGLPFSTYFSGVKVKWMYQNIPEVQEAMDDGDAMIGTVDSWIIYNLSGGRGSGVHVTDGAKPAHCACYGDVSVVCQPGCHDMRAGLDARRCMARHNVMCLSTNLLRRHASSHHRSCTMCSVDAALESAHLCTCQNASIA